jgi:hypothetical protein
VRVVLRTEVRVVLDNTLAGVAVFYCDISVGVVAVVVMGSVAEVVGEVRPNPTPSE